MFLTTSLLTAVLLALSLTITASPVEVRSSPITLPFAKRTAATGPVNLLEHDQARAAAMIERGKAIASGKLDRRGVGSFAVTNEAVSYVASVAVGSPATTYSLIIDTGSSNTWVGASTPYHATSTSVNTGQRVSVSYGSGSFSGEEWTDQLAFGPFTIVHQSIGVASKSTGFQGVDGIIGIGPTDLTEGTLTSEPYTEIPTVTDNLYNQGSISEQVVSVFFAPTTSTSSTNGELTFGGVDTTKYTGTLNYTPLTTTAPATYYWGINQSVAYGSTTILSTTAGIVDTGTTLILLASNAFSEYQSLTGAVADANTGLLRITTSQNDALQNLYFTTNGVTYALTPNGQIWPRSLNTYIGGTTGSIYLIVGNLGSPSGSGLDFINGQSFLERFYSVFDTTNSQVGLATTAYTDATTN